MVSETVVQRWIAALAVAFASVLPASAAVPATSAVIPAAWRSAVVRAQGWGRPPVRYTGARARLMAQRAAEVVAVRNLARQLNLPPGSAVRGYAYLPPIHHPDGSVTVIVEYRPCGG